MVEDDVAVVAAPDGILLRFVLVAETETDVANDDVACAHLHGAPCDADTIAGGSLARNGEVTVGDAEGAFEVNAKIGSSFFTIMHKLTVIIASSFAHTYPH